MGETATVTWQTSGHTDTKQQLLVSCQNSVAATAARQEGEKRNVKFFREDGSRAIIRHPLNQRKTGTYMRSCVSRIFSSGIVEGVRGEAWFVWDADKKQYLALTFGTLCLCSSSGHRKPVT